MDFKRKIYNDLVEWKETNKGRTALLIRGARRVGKSYITKKFGETEYKSFILIDFSRISQDTIDVFENDQTDFDLFFTKLSLIYKTKLYHRESLIIFDEIQLYPKARQLIKHLVADGRYDYIETGSLLSIKQNIKDILIPSEEEEIEMHPFDFEEFLWANGDELTIPILKQFFDSKKPLGQALHKKVMNEFRLYMVVGGMPQSVLEYVESKDLEKVNKIKTNIINLYRNDISKYARGYESKVLSIFDEIPAQLSKEAKKFKLSSITKEARFREYEDAFIWLSEGRIINTCFNTTDPNVGLKMNSERVTLKCYMADTGLLVTHALDENDVISSEISKSLVLGKLNINEGMFAENIVAQMLVSKKHKLYFYSKNDRQKNENTMEIDFLITENKKILPLEVKSGKYRGHRSLNKFKDKFSKRIGQRYVIHTKDLSVAGDVTYLPLYMTLFL